MHSFMLVRNGYVIAEGWWKPEAAEKPHVLFSLSKSFTSTAVGLAIAEGKLSLDDKVLSFFPEEAPTEPPKHLESMRVRDLLTMSTGQDSEPKFSDTESWVKTFLAHPVPFKPGTHFHYNTPATHICSAIVRKTTGETVLDYLTPRLFQPLGIEAPQWGVSPQGNTIGGSGLSLRTEDIAKFGQLYLQKGRWHDRQLVPQEWVEQATARQVSNGSDPQRDWDQGYGFQFWRCRHNAFRGDGAKGQFCVVLPEEQAVIAITAQTKDMQQQLNLVWDLLLPALGSAAGDTEKSHRPSRAHCRSPRFQLEFLRRGSLTDPRFFLQSDILIHPDHEPLGRHPCPARRLPIPPHRRPPGGSFSTRPPLKPRRWLESLWRSVRWQPELKTPPPPPPRPCMPGGATNCGWR